MPASSGNGLAMRMGLFLEALTRLGPTDLIVLPVAGGADRPPTLADSLGATTTIVPVDGRWDTQFSLIRRIADPADRLAAFRRYGRPGLAAALSAAVLADLRRLIAAKPYALVNVGRSYLGATALAVGPDPAMTLDLDEDEVGSYRQLAAELNRAGRVDDAAWADAEADGFTRLLADLPKRYSRLFISSAADAARLPQLEDRLDLVENATSIPESASRRDDGRTVLFVGSFGYQPNVAGCLWFAREVWPGIRAAQPQARLRLVGWDPPPAIRDLAEIDGIELVGPIADIADAYAEATLVIAPLHAGTGTRIKLIEAAAHGVPVVSTNLAASGLDFTAPHDLWLADDAPAFAAAVLHALADPSERLRRAANARYIAEARYDRHHRIDSLASRFEAVLASGIAVEK